MIRIQQRAVEGGDGFGSLPLEQDVEEARDVLDDLARIVESEATVGTALPEIVRLVR